MEINQKVTYPTAGPELGQSGTRPFVDSKSNDSPISEQEIIEIIEFYFCENSKIPLPFFRFADDLKRLDGGNVLAVLPYGSMINSDTQRDSWLDAFVITQDRKKFHESCRSLYKQDFGTIGKLPGYHSFLEGICAPNYYHYSFSEEGREVHFKYCPIELEELEQAVVDRDFSLTGRFMKVMRLMDDIDGDVQNRLLNIYYESIFEGLNLALDIVTEEKSHFNLRQLTYAFLGLSYFTDKRLDKNLIAKVDDIYHAEDREMGNSYDMIIKEFLRLEQFDFIEMGRNGLYSSHNLHRKHVKEIKKDLGKNWMRSVLRMYKGALTNVGSKEYALKKATKSGNLKTWMKPLKLLPKCALSLIIPIGLAYQGIAEIERLIGIGPLKKREKELDDFLDAVTDKSKLESKISSHELHVSLIRTISTMQNHKVFK